MESKTKTNKVSKQHKYRVSIYLGRDLYQVLNGMALFLNIPLATATKIVLETGVNIAMALDKNELNEVKNYGQSKV